MTPIDAMREACRYLRDLIEQDADCESIGRAQKAFLATVREAMVAYKNGEIKVDLRSLPEVMYDFVMNDLPDLCVANRETLLRSLQKIKLFLNTMDLVIKPTEVASLGTEV
ncbi:MAG: hypothetical protein K9W43_09075 [Candidatus Thorarchaeota archaeon]|nr:hypothetical protein [Candidatus Thorarchaeota archaeon]